jgi:hypothetical protein
VISTDGIKPDPTKVEAIANLPRPNNSREVRGFLGAVGFNRSFYAKYSDICCPLVDLTKKRTKFNWTKECQEAFDCLKAGLTRVPRLAYPNLNKPFILYTDASANALGALLTQEISNTDEPIFPGCPNEQPIHFMSHKFSESQRKWSVTQREAYAIFFSVLKLKFYLHNAEFIIRTDHRPLIGFLRDSKGR